ncbi:MAG: endonuclease/exonuclease/phosphatase family protein, partial [SAR324 cluster bacterium]|nr:endonuclease/exonuclease/phosphatase family protein [SAR324 cluster bacterium]
MKIVTWNCNGALRKKLETLENFDADILVIQECENPELSTKDYKEWASNFLWKGDNKNKGIGIFAKKDIELKR